MKRATIGGCKLEIYYEGEQDGLAISDPVSVWLILPDCDLIELTGTIGNTVKADIWCSGGWLYKAESIKEVD